MCTFIEASSFAEHLKGIRLVYADLLHDRFGKRTDLETAVGTSFLEMLL